MKRKSFFERVKAETMETKQFYDEALAHASYAVVSKGKMALVDPGRDPQPYLDFARQYFKHTLNIPLFELSERIREVKTDKPIVVHCGDRIKSLTKGPIGY